MYRYIIIAVFLATLPSSVASAGIMFKDLGANDLRIDTVTDVEIGGIFYDATFLHGISYNDLLLQNPGEPTFTNAVIADAAMTALRESIGFEMANVSGSILITEQYWTGTGIRPTPITPPRHVGVAIDKRLTSNPLNYRSSLRHRDNGVILAKTQLPDSYAWVSFSPSVAAVPEPGSLVVWALSIGAGCFGWRQRPS